MAPLMIIWSYVLQKGSFPKKLLKEASISALKILSFIKRLLYMLIITK